jgi:hypothetical protein
MTMAAKKRKRQPKIEFTGWEYIAFADLHVSAKTLDRCLTVLATIEQQCVALGIREVVFTGDWWDARGVLSVRQFHDLKTALRRWDERGIELHLIPGNHDQVAEDGSIHGLEVFEGLSNVHVYTEPYYDNDRHVAYIPWREVDQEALFDTFDKTWTVFAHAEVEGATTNTRHAAEGKVKLATMEKAGLTLCGHYHKRQQLGESTWYIGNPYEKDFGEMGDPKGIAIIREGVTEPEFLNFTMPQHWRLNWPEDKDQFPDPAEQDIVEVYCPDTQMETQAFREALGLIPANDVRPLPKSDIRHTGKGAPTFAMGLEEAIPAYVYQESGTDQDSAASPVKATTNAELIKVGSELLVECPDAGVTVPWGKVTRLIDVTVSNFCAIAGSVTMPLDRLGAALLRGDMGTGKTSTLDAVTWCFYGVTTPRKPGATSASLKADDVINDNAEEAAVTVRVQVDDHEIVSITRKKQRGSGAKVRLDNAPRVDGIADQQALIHHIVGIDYTLWRSCVYLGQGAVGNFLTDAGKRRMELLGEAFQLEACPHVVKMIRKRLKTKTTNWSKLQASLTDVLARKETLEAMNFSTDVSTWEARRAGTIKANNETIEAASAKITEMDTHLAKEDEWRQGRASHAANVETLEKSLTGDPGVALRTGKLHADLGAANARRQAATQALGDVRKRYAALNAPGANICTECGQALSTEQVETKAQELEATINGKASDLQTSEARVANLQVELGKITQQATPEAEGVRAALQDARGSVAKCDQGILAIEKMKITRKGLSDDWEKARKVITEENAAVNPYAQRQKERDDQLVQYQTALVAYAADIASLSLEIDRLQFWEGGFGAKGLPVVVLRTALYELESYANTFLGKLLRGRLSVRLEMFGDDLKINFWEQGKTVTENSRERSYIQLSGGMKRCAELAFTPFALSEMIFNRTGVRLPILFIDELTTHLDPTTKPIVCQILRELGRETVLVVDHDESVQGEFDQIFDVKRLSNQSVSVERAA